MPRKKPLFPPKKSSILFDPAACVPSYTIHFSDRRQHSVPYFLSVWLSDWALNLRILHMPSNGGCLEVLILVYLISLWTEILNF